MFASLGSLSLLCPALLQVHVPLFRFPARLPNATVSCSYDSGIISSGYAGSCGPTHDGTCVVCPAGCLSVCPMSIGVGLSFLVMSSNIRIYAACLISCISSLSLSPNVSGLTLLMFTSRSVCSSYGFARCVTTCTLTASTLYSMAILCSYPMHSRVRLFPRHLSSASATCQSCVGATGIMNC